MYLIVKYNAAGQIKDNILRAGCYKTLITFEAKLLASYNNRCLKLLSNLMHTAYCTFQASLILDILYFADNSENPKSIVYANMANENAHVQ